MASLLLSPDGLHRATCNPLPSIVRPESAISELPERRTRTGKIFAMANGSRRQIISICPQHYWNGEWHEINTNLEAVDSRLFDVHRAPYFFRNLESGVGFGYKSRGGGFARMRLIRIGNQRINYADKPEPAGNVLRYRGLAIDTDLHYHLLPAKVGAWCTLHSPLAPREWEWEVLHRGEVCVATNVRGWDAAGNALEIVQQVCTQRLGGGLKRTQLIKRWTGRAWKRGEQRRREYVEPVYPVAIDPDITESIVAEGDDGVQNSSTLLTDRVWIGLAYGSFFYHPALRFQTVAIPNGDTIDLANLKITQYQHAGNGGSGTIYFYDVDDTPAWSTSIKPSGVAKTSASTNWPASTTDNAKTFDVTTSLQEIVLRAGWASGNDVSPFALNNVGSGTHTSRFNDYPTAGFSTLEIDYTTASTGQPAVKRMGGVQFAHSLGRGIW